MRRVSRLVVVVLVLSLPIAGALAIGSPQGPATAALDTDPAESDRFEGSNAGVSSSTGQRSLGSAQEFDSTTFVVRTYANGSARFTIRYERRLANESEREQFETYATRFENQSTDLYENFQTRAQSLTSAGKNATGRDMRASSFKRDARVEERFNTLGIIELSFMWTSFADVRGDGRVVAGDVFDGGIYLGPNQAIVFQHGDRLRFASVDPEGSISGDSLAGSDSVTWQGERDFSDERPRAVFVSADAATTSSNGTTDGGGAGPGDDPGDGTGDGDGLGMLPMVALALVAVLVAAFAFREYGGGLVTTDDDGDGGAGTQAQSGSSMERADAPSGAGADTGAAGASAGGATTPREPAVADEELLTDEDRVVSLLEDHGGRMRQVNIVEETGWSKSKVSMLLTDMEEADTISKLRVGRENIVSLSGHEPDVAGSPFEDDDPEPDVDD